MLPGVAPDRHGRDPGRVQRLPALVDEGGPDRVLHRERGGDGVVRAASADRSARAGRPGPGRAARPTGRTGSAGRAGPVTVVDQGQRVLGEVVLPGCRRPARPRRWSAGAVEGEAARPASGGTVCTVTVMGHGRRCGCGPGRRGWPCGRGGSGGRNRATRRGRSGRRSGPTSRSGRPITSSLVSAPGRARAHATVPRAPVTPVGAAATSRPRSSDVKPATAAPP